MQTIRLTQEQFKIPPTVHMVQNDERTLKMVIADIIYEDGDVGTLYFKRSDGSYYSVQTEFSGSDNSYTAVVTQALTQAGITECQLKVDSSAGYVSTYTFYIDVQESVSSADVVEQEGYSVQELVQAARDISAGGMPTALRLALLQIAQKVAYIDENGQQYYQDLYDALQPDVTLISISAVYTQSGTVYDTDALDDLKADLVVTATYSDSSTETLPASAYTLSGTLTEGTSTITVTYEGKTDTFDVAVTYWQPEFTIVQGSSDFGTTGTVKYNGSEATRCVTNPMGFKTVPGRYRISLGTYDGASTYYFGCRSGGSTAFDGANWNVQYGTSKTIVSGATISYDWYFEDHTNGWKNVSSVWVTTEEKPWLFVNFKKGSAGNTAFNATDIASLINQVTITRL